MSTLNTAIISRARKTLLETTASFWTDAELLEHFVAGAKDLWGAIADLHQEHHATLDITTMSIAASGITVTGVPADLFRVLLIEPRDLTSAGTGRDIRFIPRDYNSPEFASARGMSAVDPSNGTVIYYTLTGVGAPISAPTIHVGPSVTSALNLRVLYIPTLADSALASGQVNPIPGESDNALYAWIIAYARAKERDDRSPDPNWLAIYATEKQNIITRLTPRQEQEPEYVSGMFEDFDY